MKVSVWHNNKDIRIEERPVPAPGPGELLVKVHACGICGSDVSEWYRLPRAPLIQGHEIGAEVIQTGDGTTRFKTGERLAAMPKIPCLSCDYCADGHFPQCTEIKERLPGGFAEYMVIPRSIVQHGTFQLPDNMTYQQATFIEPLACVVRAQRIAGISRLSPKKKSGALRTVCILGSGMSGILNIRLAKAAGWKVIATDIAPEKMEWARKSGADFVIRADSDVPAEIIRTTGAKADAVIVTAGAVPPALQAWDIIDKGGSIVFFAVPSPEKTVTIPLNRFWMQEITVATSYYCGPSDMEEAMQLISIGTVRVDDLITHVLPLDKTAEGFDLVINGKGTVKVIITPSG